MAVVTVEQGKKKIVSSTTEVFENQRVFFRQVIVTVEDFKVLLNVAKQYLNEQGNILQQMRVLVIEAKKNIYTQNERNSMGQEFQTLGVELNTIAQTAHYNGTQLFYWKERHITATDDPKVMDDATGAWDTAADAVFGADDDGGASLFNVKVGTGYTAADIAAKNPANQYNSFEKTAENYISVQFGMMDIKGLFNKTTNTGTQAWIHITGNGTVNPFDWNNGVGLQGINWNSLEAKLNTLLQLINGENLTHQNAVQWSGGTNYTGLERINRMCSYVDTMMNKFEEKKNNLVEEIKRTEAAEGLYSVQVVWRIDEATLMPVGTTHNVTFT